MAKKQQTQAPMTDADHAEIAPLIGVPKKVPDVGATIDGNTLTLAFSDGSTLMLNALGTTEAIRAQAMMHGFKQKLVDAAAISRNPDTGRTASIADKAAAVREVYDRLMAGEWNKGRTGGGNEGGLLLRALCAMYPDKTPEALREYLGTKSDEEKNALRNQPRVAQEILKIKAASIKAGDVDADALLDQLGKL